MVPAFKIASVYKQTKTRWQSDLVNITSAGCKVRRKLTGAESSDKSPRILLWGLPSTHQCLFGTLCRDETNEQIV